jgi:hypothetical protein
MRVPLAQPEGQFLYLGLPLLAFAVGFLQAMREKVDFPTQLVEHLGRFFLDGPTAGGQVKGRLRRRGLGFVIIPELLLEFVAAEASKPVVEGALLPARHYKLSVY